MPLIYKPYQANIANKAGQKLYYPRLVKFSKMVNTQKMAELIAEKASLTPGDVHNVIRNLMSVMREQLLNSRTVRLEGLGTFTMIAKAGGKGVVLESKVSSSQIVSLRCQFTPEYTRSADGVTTRALTSGVEFVHVKDVAGGFVDDDDKNHSGGGDNPGGGSTPGMIGSLIKLLHSLCFLTLKKEAMKLFLEKLLDILEALLRFRRRKAKKTGDL